MMQDSNGRYYEFGSFRIDPLKRLLLRDGSPVALPPKAFDALLILLENSGHVVERDGLMAKLCPDTFVEDINYSIGSRRVSLPSSFSSEQVRTESSI